MGETNEPDVWPRASLPGGWVLGSQWDPETDSRVRRLYRSASWVRRRVGMSHAFNDLRRSDGGIWVCDPAILIGPTPGWEEQDVAAWGIDCGLLDEAGEIRNQRDQREALRAQGVQVRAARRKFTEPLASWRRVTRVYLNQVDLAAGLQIDHRNVIHRKRRGGLPEGAVTIETLDGWADDQMHQWSRQVNRPYSTPDYIARAVLENEGRLI